MTFTARDLRDQIVTATRDGAEGEYDVDAILEEIIAKYGAVDIETIDTDKFWDIVGKHAAASIATAQEWADAIDAHQKGSGQSAGEIISRGYANGQIVGVALDPSHPDADDERGIVASNDGWVVRYVEQSGWWEAV